MQIVLETSNPFRSFWMAGFECTDKLNAFGDRVDFSNITGHLDYINNDNKNLHEFNIATVREGIRWSQVEKEPYEYDWSAVATIIKAGKNNNIQQVWDLCHFGFPDDLTPLHPMFARRFAALCKSFVRFYRSLSPEDTLIVIPINEVSFISWLGGEVCGTTPYCKGYGWEVKYNLMGAYIEGIEAIKETDASERILTSEPLINIVAPFNATPDQVTDAILKHEHQFQVIDILCGRMCPELRGRPEYIDMIGLNYYFDNQWVCDTFESLIWKSDPLDERWEPLNNLISEVYQRYNKPIVITETSHPKGDRPLWINMIAAECAAVLKANIPLLGVCIYPIIDRPDWDDLSTWHHSGLWDIDIEKNNFKRILYKPMAEALMSAQKELENIFITESRAFVNEARIISAY